MVNAAIKSAGKLQQCDSRIGNHALCIGLKEQTDTDDTAFVDHSGQIKFTIEFFQFVAVGQINQFPSAQTAVA